MGHSRRTPEARPHLTHHGGYDWVFFFMQLDTTEAPPDSPADKTQADFKKRARIRKAGCDHLCCSPSCGFYGIVCLL